MSTVSVAIATYNGEKYIKEQLESILGQTRVPDDVQIFDDVSTDRTITIIKEFINENRLENRWHLKINSKQLGCELNFIEAAKATTGDIIFFSDQDDIWYDTKIERMTKVLEENENALGVTCLSDYTDGNGNKIKKLSERFTTNLASGLIRYDFESQVKYNRSAGLEIAFKRAILNDLTILVKEYDVKHDQPVGMLASLKGEYYGINERLLAHRVHTDNLSAPRISLINRVRYVSDQIEGNEEHLKHMSAFYDFAENEIPDSNKNVLCEAIAMTQESINALQNRNLIASIRILLRPNSMVNRWIRINNCLCILFGDYKSMKKYLR